MGEPKATEMPDAAAAERTSLLRAGRWLVEGMFCKELDTYLRCR